MNKIQRIVFTMACLLTFTGGYAWKIVNLVKEGGVGTGATFTATYDSSPVVLNSTDIPDNGIVTLNISLNGDGYYLKKIEYEEVMDLGGAESRWNRAPGPGPGFATRGTIAINTDHAHSYAGDYIFTMPASDVVIYATFAARNDISGFSLTLDGTDVSKEYDGYAHVLTLKNGDTPLTIDVDYTISPSTYSWTNVFSATPTVTGIGKYKGTKTGVTLSITQKNLTIIADNGQSKVYGASDPVFTYTATGLCSGGQISGALGRAAGENVGSYAINIGTLTAGSNYTIDFTSKNFTISQKNLSDVTLSITLDHDYFNYSGGVQKAEISTIKYGNTTLTEGAGNDYTYAYGTGVYTFTDYTTPDIYPITITFTGNYTGTKTVNYQIRPEITLNNSTRWRTFYESTYNMVVPATFTAHTVSAITSSAVELTPREVIKAGTPMLLYRTGDTSSGIYPELIPTSDARLADSYWTNVSTKFLHNADAWNLTGDDAIQDGTKKIMILVNDKFVRTKSGTLASGKCYLDITGTTLGSRDLSLDDDGTTNISEEVKVNSNKFATAEWYDLKGRRVLFPTKGIYIVNGKKIIIK